MEEVRDYRTDDDARYGEPIDGLYLIATVKICPAVQEVAENENDTYGRKCAVEYVEPVAEIPVKPNGRNSPNEACNKDENLFVDAKDVAETKSGGVEGIVICRPDVEAED